MKEKKKGKLPEGWRWENLNKIARIFSGSSAPQGDLYFENGKYPFVRVSDLGNFGRTRDLTHIRDKLNDFAVNHLSLIKAKKGTILFPKSGAAILTNNRAILGLDAFIVSHLAAIEPIENFSTSLWIYFWFSQLDMNDYMDNQGYPSLKTSRIAEILIPLPPTLDDQTRIASELEHKMAGMEKMRQAALRQKEAVAAMQGAVLRKVFPYKEGDKLPEGWRWEKLSAICIINPTKNRNISRDPNAQTSFIPMDAVDGYTGRITKRIRKKYRDISNGYTYFEEGDVLFAKITPCMQNGKSAIAENLIDGFGFGSTEFHVLRAEADIIKEWIYYFVRTKEFRKRAEEHFEGSAGQQRVPVEFIENSFIPLPPTLDDQIRITSELEHKMAEMEKMRQSADRQLEASEALPGAILREVFDFEETKEN